MMLGCCPLLLLLVLASAIGAPSGDLENYPEIVPQKRAALVLDRLLIALQKALREDEVVPDRRADGPHAAPLRIASGDSDMMGGGRMEWAPWRAQGPPAPGPALPLQAALEDDMRALQRRGQASTARNRVVLRCYFNAITCF